jgi:hypothetical protein
MGIAPAESEGRRVEVGARAKREAGGAIVDWGFEPVRSVGSTMTGDMCRRGLSFDRALPGLASAERSRSRGNMA